MLSAIATLAHDDVSPQSKSYWVKGLFQYLAEQGQLHLLFPSKHLSLAQQVSEYLALHPANEHHIEQTALQFNMSRATLIRKLNQENKKFREILMEVRLNHALNIIQHQKITNIAIIAQACGYLSDAKFSLRFKEKFGLSVKQYIETVYGK
ncbi:helix-turn-helix domain-containing protein [Vibrio stylophorae]|nr:AraC family transcriptional regulator [Vibrio stylophorae]